MLKIVANSALRSGKKKESQNILETEGIRKKKENLLKN